MAITINGNGTITGITAGGLPAVAVTPADGSITTAKLANNAVTHAKSTGLQRRISTTVTLPTNTDRYDHTVTAGVKKIELLLNNVSSSSNTNTQVRLGDAGNSMHTSGYNYASGFHRTGTSSREATVTNFTDGFKSYGLDSASYNLFGNYKLWNPGGNVWLAEHIIWGDDAANHTFYGNGYQATDSALTTLIFRVIGGNFDEGSITIIETLGDD